jgi:hypothetical protein
LLFAVLAGHVHALAFTTIAALCLFQLNTIRR